MSLEEPLFSGLVNGPGAPATRSSYCSIAGPEPQACQLVGTDANTVTRLFFAGRLPGATSA